MENLLQFFSNHLFLCLLFIAITSLLLWNIVTGISATAQLSAVEVTKLINHENAIVLDIRNKMEFEQGHIIHSINTTLAALVEEHSLQKYKDKVVVICCRYGVESMRAMRSLKAKGAERIYCLKGGIGAWEKDSLPMVKSNV